MLPLTEAATILGLDTRRKLYRCVTYAAICATPALHDGRRKMITDEQFEALRAARDAIWPQTPPTARHNDPQAASLPAAVEARLAMLERRVASLEAQLARRSSAPAPAPHEPADTLPSDVPDGAMQAGPFAQQIGVPETTLRRWVQAGAVETVSRASAKPGQMERWLTPAGQQQARERAARRGA